MKKKSIYQVNFLPWRQQQLVKKKIEFALLMVAISCSTLLLFIFYCVLQSIESANLFVKNQYYQQQWQQIQQISMQLTEKKNQLDKLITRKTAIDEYTLNNQSLLNLLQSLPSITPSKSWLNSFELLGMHLEIKAHSYHFQDISRFTHRLENSQLFHDVQLRKLGRIKNLNHLHLSAKHQRVATHE